MDAARGLALQSTATTSPGLYARANSPAGRLDPVTIAGKSPPEFFPVATVTPAMTAIPARVSLWRYSPGSSCSQS